MPPASAQVPTPPMQDSSASTQGQNAGQPTGDPPAASGGRPDNLERAQTLSAMAATTPPPAAAEPTSHDDQGNPWRDLV